MVSDVITAKIAVIGAGSTTIILIYSELEKGIKGRRSRIEITYSIKLAKNIISVTYMPTSYCTTHKPLF